MASFRAACEVPGTTLSTTETTHFADPFIAARSAPLGAWIQRTLRRIAGREAPGPSSARDRVREAAAVRNWAATLRDSDPRFVDDLLAAADRHERDVP